LNNEQRTTAVEENVENGKELLAISMFEEYESKITTTTTKLRD
jgi:hypothetical protein